MSTLLVGITSNESYHVCKFKNTCFTKSKIIVYVKNSANILNSAFDECCVKKTKCNRLLLKREICICFSLRSYITFEDISGMAKNTSFISGNTWMINQFSRSSHPSHFSFKMIPTGIIFNMREKFQLPKIMHRIYWQDYETNNLTEFESNIFDIAISSKKVHVGELLFSPDNICFSNTYTNQYLQVYSKKKEHLIYFQEYAEKKMGLRNLVYGRKTNGCPPRKAVLITRVDGKGKRNLIGIDYISEYLKSKNYSFEKFAISKLNSSFVQAKTFNSFGIIITPWSSQLTNIIFAQKRAVSMIITPFCYENVFPKLSNVSGLHTILSLGHKPSGENFGNQKCLHSKSFYEKKCFKTWRELIENHDTIIDKEIIEKDLAKAISLIENCYTSRHD